MSIQLMSDVWRTDLPTVEKMVLLVIADHANDQGTQSYPSQQTIANKASISVRTVQRSVNTLVERGFIRVFKGQGGSANCRDDRRPHLYMINIGKLRHDTMTPRQARPDIEDIDGATMTTVTGRQSRPMNHPIEPPIETPGFDDFWNVYPLKVGKGAAKKAFEKAIRTTDVDSIIKGALRYKLDPNRVQSYTAHASTWLNAQRWLDEPLPPKILNADEKRAAELRASQEKTLREQEETKSWFAELEKQRLQAVPMPESIKEILKKSLTNQCNNYP